MGSWCGGLGSATAWGVKPRAKRLLRNVGRRIAEARVARRLTQERLAERLGVSARYVQSVEGGDENLTLETLDRFATVLRIDVAALLEPPTTPPTRRGRTAAR